MPRLEALEDRTLLNADTLSLAAPLTLLRGQLQSLSSQLDNGSDVNLFKFKLTAGDVVVLDLDAQSQQSSLNGMLRLFDSNGVEQAHDFDADGLDPALTFRAASTGTYYVGISAEDNATYNPDALDGRSGTSTGNFQLNATLLDLDPSTAALLGRQWNDLNGDGVRGSGEAGLAGWTVFLDTNANATLDNGELNTTTDANGDYRFVGLTAGSYHVTALTPDDYRRTTTANTPVTLLQADFSATGGAASADGFTTSGDTNQWHLSTRHGTEPGHSSADSYYFGTEAGTYDNNSTGSLISPLLDLRNSAAATLHFKHWLELESEQDYDFASVLVRKADGSTEVLATSDPRAISGTILSGTTAGNWAAVTLDLQAYLGQQISIEFNFAADSIYTFEGWYVDDVHVDVQSKNIKVVPLVAGQAQLNVDFGAQQYATLEGTVWEDLNSDGVFDQGEPAAPQQHVYLDSNNNQQLDAGEHTALTDAYGQYRFQYLIPGTYHVLLVQEQTFPGAPRQNYFAADFSDAQGDGSTEGFTGSGPANQWHLTTQRGSDSDHSPSHSFHFGSTTAGSNYQNSADGTLTSTVIDLSNVSGPINLDFNQWLASETAYDFAEVRVLHGGTSTLLARAGGLLPHTTSGWQAVQLNLSAYAGQQIQLQFKFTSDSLVNYEGWYIDDVAVYSPAHAEAWHVTVAPGATRANLDFGRKAKPDLLATSFEIVTTQHPEVWYGDTITISYTIHNQGLVDVGAFSAGVYLSKYSFYFSTYDPLIQTLNFAGLAAGATLSGTLDATLPGSPGRPPAADFHEPDTVYVGLIVDPFNHLLEENEFNNSNQGETIDSAALVIALPPLPDIRGTIWSDLDDDGQHDDNEPGQAGVTVYIDANDDGQFDSYLEAHTVTDTNGDYVFTNVAPGTHVVRIALPAGQTVTSPRVTQTLLYADFSDGNGSYSPDGFTADGGASSWYLVTNHDDGSHSSPYSVYYGYPGPYASNSNTTLYSPWLDLRAVSGPVTLEFKHFLATEEGYDFAEVLVETTTGITTLARSGEGVFPHDTNGWETVQLDLSPYAGQYVRVRWHFTSDASVEEEGWYVDDVSVVGQVSTNRQAVTVDLYDVATGIDFGKTAYPDLLTTSFNIVDTQAYWGDTITVQYTIVNQGLVDVGAFDASVLLSTNATITTGDVLLRTLSFTGLAAGATLTGTIQVTLPGAAGLPPVNFTEPDDIFVGLYLDQANQHVEENEGNNASTGLGLDFDSLAMPIPPAGQIEGTIWKDLNGDGVHQENEPGYAGISVYLDRNNNSIRDGNDLVTTTDAAGFYRFANVYPGRYQVVAAYPDAVVGTAPVSSPPQILFEADFVDEFGNASPEGVVLGGPANQWHLTGVRGTDPGHLGYFSAYFGAGEDVATGTTGKYSNNAEGFGTSPVIDLRHVPGPVTLDFNYWLEAEVGNDFAEVAVLDGATTTVIARSGGLLPFVSNGWQHASFDLSAFTGKQIQLRFRFTSDFATTREGWYVDDVIVSTQQLASQAIQVHAGEAIAALDFLARPPADLRGVTFTVDQSQVFWGDSITVHYTIENHGEGAAGAFVANLLVSDDSTLTNKDVVITTLSFDGLAAGATLSGTFQVTLPGSQGSPPGRRFTEPDAVFVGLLLDSGGTILETDEDNNANRGTGIDRDTLAIAVPAPGEIRGQVWNDIDGDGIHDANERGLEDVLVYLDTNNNNFRDSNDPFTTTDAQGNYLFPVLKPGLYRVGQVLAGEQTQTSPLPPLLHATFSDSEENAINEGFVVVGSGAPVWHTTTRRSSEPNHSADVSMYFGGANGKYPNDTDQGVRSPLIDLRNLTGSATLEFNHYLAALAGDVASVNVITASGTHLLASTAAGTLRNTETADNVNSWETQHFDLSAYLGQQIQIEFRFTADAIYGIEGWYVDDVVVRAGDNTGLRSVALVSNAVVTGIDFGNRPAPDLRGIDFQVVQSEAIWGGKVTIQYRIENHSSIAAGAFDVSLRLAANAAQLTTNFLELSPDQPLHFAGLAAGGVLTGTIEQQLPGAPNTPPSNFQNRQTIVLGLVIDPVDAVFESNESNNAQRGLALDLDTLAMLPPPTQITGTIWLDLNGDGLHDADEPGAAGVTVYLDQNNNRVLDNNEHVTTTDDVGNYRFDRLDAGTYVVRQIVPANQAQTSPIVAAQTWFEADFSDADGNLAADGFTNTIAPNNWYLGTFHSELGVHSSPGNVYFGNGPSGTYANNANSILYSPWIDLSAAGSNVTLDFQHYLASETNWDYAEVWVDNGTTVSRLARSGAGLPHFTTGWESVHLDLSAYAGQQIQIQFRFTSDSSVTYEGWYLDDIRVSSAFAALPQQVTVNTGETVENIDFNNQPFPDLAGVHFEVVEGTLQWGQTVTIRYTVANQGDQVAGPFTTGIYLSSNSTIATSDTLLHSWRIEGLAARAQSSGTFELTLPGSPLVVPNGFTTPGDVYLGLVIDTTNEVSEGTESNNSNRGSGLDRDTLTVRFPPGRIEGIAYADPNGSGDHQADEAVLAGVTVFLDLNANGILDTNEAVTVTDATGHYAFTDLQPGNYRVQSVTPASYARTLPGGSLFMATFADGNTAGFTTTGAASEWQLTTRRANDAGHSATHSFYFGTNGTYSNSAAGTLRSPEIDLTGVTGPVALRFNSLLNIETNYDFAEIWMVNEQNVRQRLARSDVQLLVSYTDGWTQFTTNLPGASGQRIHLEFIFTSDSVVNQEGWYVDDIEVYRPDRPTDYLVNLQPGATAAGRDFLFQAQPDLIGTRFAVSTSDATWGEVIAVDYTIQNQGLGTASSFTFDLRLSSDNQFTADDPLLLTVDNLNISLAPGAQVSGQLLVRLPALPPPGFTAASPVFVGLRLDPTHALPESNEVNNQSQQTGRDHARLQMLDLLTEQEVNNTLPLAQLLAQNSRLQGTTQTGDVDLYKIQIGQTGRLTARVEATNVNTRLALLREDGSLLLNSAGQSLTDPDDLIEQHLRPGIYYLRVEPLTAGPGSYLLTTRFDAALPPFNDITVGTVPLGLVTADFNVDGIVDLATADSTSNSISILLGLGDGTFAPRQTVTDLITTPGALAVGDFNEDGYADLVVSNTTDDSLVVLLGKGDGSFNRSVLYHLDASNPGSLAVGDFNGDRHVDFVVANRQSNDLRLFLGDGRGNFNPQLLATPLPVQPGPIVAADFDGDGDIDVVGGSYTQPRIWLADNQGNGQFVVTEIGSLPEQGGIRALAVGQLDNRLGLDLVAASSGDTRNAIVLLNDGPHHYSGLTPFTLRDQPTDLKLVDLNGDHVLDLLAANNTGNSVALAVGLNNGTFEVIETTLPTGNRPVALVSADFNNDGRLDVATANSTGGNSVSIVFALRDTVFPTSGNRVAVGDGPTRLVAADVNGDGLTDLATLNSQSGDVSVLLRQGAGVFTSVTATTDIGGTPTGLVSGRFNNDRRDDLAVVSSQTNKVSILESNGDGTFVVLHEYAVGVGPQDLVTADINNDGQADLITANQSDRTLTVLLGLGDGTFFNTGYPVQLRRQPYRLVVGDFDGNGNQDLAVYDQFTNDITILMGRGDGFFTDVGVRISLRRQATALAVGNFAGDGHLDLIVSNTRTASVTVLTGTGKGTFEDTGLDTPLSGSLLTPAELVVSHFDTDPFADVALLDRDGRSVSVLRGRGDGMFQVTASYISGLWPSDLVAADLTGNGLLDLATVNYGSSDVSLFQGFGNDQFSDRSVYTDRLYATPVLADVTGDGVADAVVVNTRGELLLRQGRPGFPGVFEAPQQLNNAPAAPARAVVAVVDQLPNQAPRTRLAAIDKSGTGFTVYTVGTQGQVLASQHIAPPGAALLVQLATADLNGDGRGDLVVANPGGNQLFVYRGKADGTLEAVGQLQQFQAGNGPADLALADADANGTLDILVSNQVSGDVSVFLNQGGITFADAMLFRAGTGAHGLEADVQERLAVRSQERTSSLGVGDFNRDGVLDAVVAHPGSGTFAVLLGQGGGNLVLPTTTAALAQPAFVRVAQLNDDNHDNKIDANDFLDLVLLHEDTATFSVWLGDGAGGFTHLPEGDGEAGNAPLGFTVADVNRDGKNDLLVGNDYGDVLTILGNGDGTFQAFRRAGRNVPFVTADYSGRSLDFNGDGLPDVLVANQQTDEVSVMLRQRGSNTFISGPVSQGLSVGVLGPVAPLQVDLNGDGVLDIVVANSGSNSISVFLGTAAQAMAQGGTSSSFSPVRTYFVGTNPTGLTLQDLNNDNILDIAVANRGSNDVSILFGSGSGSSWDLRPGARLRVGRGPIAVTVRDANGDHLNDLVVTNSQDGTMTILPGMSAGGLPTGFFNDAAATVLTLPRELDGQAAQIVAQANGFLITGAGTLLDLNNFSAVYRSPLGHEVQYVTALSGGSGSSILFTANADGSLSRLDANAAGEYTETQVLRDTGLTDPSALQIVHNGDRLELYVTEAGKSIPIVFSLTSEGLFTSNTTLTSDLSPVGDSSGAIVVTLFVLPTGETSIATDETTLNDGIRQTSFIIGLGQERDRRITGNSGTEEELTLEEGLQELARIARAHWPAVEGAVIHYEKMLTTMAAQFAHTTLQPVDLVLQTFGIDKANLPDLHLPAAANDLARALFATGQSVGVQLRKNLGVARQDVIPAGAEVSEATAPSVTQLAEAATPTLKWWQQVLSPERLWQTLGLAALFTTGCFCGAYSWYLRRLRRQKQTLLVPEQPEIVVKP